MSADKLQQIETYVRRSMDDVVSQDHKIAHDFKHVDRVRRWALAIARGEGFVDLELVEAAALLHDVGLAHVKRRSQHAQAGAKVAGKFLRERALFSVPEIEAIVDAVRNHNALGEVSALATIVRDADILDMVGAVGIMRAFTSKHSHPEYEPGNVKGETWGITAEDVDRLFTEGKGIGPTIVDQINFQASCYGNLRTEIARRVAAPLVEFMRGFLIQLECEVRGAGYVGSDEF